MLKTNNKEEEQIVLDKINDDIESYSTKMTKSQLKWEHQKIACTVKTPYVSMTHVEESAKKKKKRGALTAAVGAEKRMTNLIVKTEIEIV